VVSLKASFNLLLQLLTQAQQEGQLGGNEEGANHQAHDVVNKSGFFAFKVVTNELNRPPDHKQSQTPAYQTLVTTAAKPAASCKQRPKNRVMARPKAKSRRK